MMADPSVLTGTSLFTLLAMFTRRAQVLTESACVSWSTLAFPGHMVTGGSVLALALLLTAIAIGARLARGLAAPPSVPRCAQAGSGDRVTQGSILALASVATVWSPVLTVTGTGAVGAAPARLTLAGAGGHAAAMNTALRTERSTNLSILIKAWAALGFAPVHGFLASAVGRPVAHPVSGAFEPVEDVCAAGVVNLVVGMCIGLLHGNGVTFPVAADVGILQV